MAHEDGIVSLEGAQGVLEDDVLVPPTNDPDAVAEPSVAGLSRLLVGAMVASADDACRLVTLSQAEPNGPFEPASDAQPVNEVDYKPILAGGTVTDGRIGFVAVRREDQGVDLILQHMGESAAGPTHPGTAGPEWERPIDLGRPAERSFTALQIGLDAAGRIAVFGLAAEDQAVWWLYRNPPKIVMKEVTVTPPGTSEPITISVPELQPADPPFSDWQKLAGAEIGSFTLANNADGRIVLFAETDGTTSLVYNEPRTMHATDPSDWYGWEEVAANGNLPFHANTLTASIDDAGALNVFAIDCENQVAHSRQKPAGSRIWTGYTYPGMATTGFDHVTAGIDGDGNVMLGAFKDGGPVWANREQVAPIGVWSGWSPSFLALATVQAQWQSMADGRLAFFGVTSPDDGGVVWTVAQAAFESTEWDAGITRLLTDARVISVQRDLRLPGA